MDERTAIARLESIFLSNYERSYGKDNHGRIDRAIEISIHGFKYISVFFKEEGNEKEIMMEAATLLLKYVVDRVCVNARTTP